MHSSETEADEAAEAAWVKALGAAAVVTPGITLTSRDVFTFAIDASNPAPSSPATNATAAPVVFDDGVAFEEDVAARERLRKFPILV